MRVEIKLSSPTKSDFLSFDKDVIGDALAQYLSVLSHHSSESFFSKALVHAMLYYDCLHTPGFHRVASISGLFEAATSATAQKTQNLKITGLRNDADLIPDLCNEFVVVYCASHSDLSVMPSATELVDLTNLLCAWLFTVKITHSQLVQLKIITN